MQNPTRRILPKRVNENHVGDVVVVRKRHHDLVGVDIPTARFGKRIVRKLHTALSGNLAEIFGNGWLSFQGSFSQILPPVGSKPRFLTLSVPTNRYRNQSGS